MMDKKETYNEIERIGVELYKLEKKITQVASKTSDKAMRPVAEKMRKIISQGLYDFDVELMRLL